MSKSKLSAMEKKLNSIQTSKEWASDSDSEPEAPVAKKSKKTTKKDKDKVIDNNADIVALPNSNDCDDLSNDDNMDISTSSTTTKSLKTGKGSAKQNRKNALSSKQQSLNSKIDQTPSSTIYLGHIPLALTENELNSFLSQFGSVSHVHLSRSKKTGNPKGYGFITFIDSDVAEVVVGVMNGYFLDGRRLISHVLKVGDLKEGMLKGRFVKIDFVAQNRKVVNGAVIDGVVEGKKVEKRLSKKQKKLEGLGIDFDVSEVLKPKKVEVVKKGGRKASVDESVGEEKKSAKKQKIEKEEAVVAVAKEAKKTKKSIVKEDAPEFEVKSAKKTPKSAKKDVAVEKKVEEKVVEEEEVKLKIPRSTKKKDAESKVKSSVKKTPSKAAAAAEAAEEVVKSSTKKSKPTTSTPKSDGKRKR